MRKGFWFPLLLIPFVFTPALKAEDSVMTDIQNVDVHETESRPKAPGLIVDAPSDLQVNRLSENSYQIETTEHYAFRKIADQNKRLDDTDQKLAEMTARLDSIQNQIKTLQEERQKKETEKVA